MSVCDMCAFCNIHQDRKCTFSGNCIVNTYNLHGTGTLDSFVNPKVEAVAEEAPVVSTTLSIPFSGPAERSLYFTENPDFTAPSAGIHSRRFPGSRSFVYSSAPEHDLAAVPSSLFDVLHRYFAVHSPDDIVLWKDGILSFQTMENQPQPLTALCTPDDARDSKIIPFPTLSERQRISQ